MVDIVGPGTFFGDMACIGQNMQDSFAEAAEDALVCVMSRNDIQTLMLDKPTVALRILEAVGQRLVEMTTRLEETTFLGAQERIAALLLRLATHKDGQLVVEGYSHQDLAYMLGTYRETVTNALDHLKAEGLIEVSRKRVVLLEPERIRELAWERELSDDASEARVIQLADALDLSPEDRAGVQGQRGAVSGFFPLSVEREKSYRRMSASMPALSLRASLWGAPASRAHGAGERGLADGGAIWRGAGDPGAGSRNPPSCRGCGGGSTNGGVGTDVIRGLHDLRSIYAYGEVPFHGTCASLPSFTKSLSGIQPAFREAAYGANRRGQA